MRGIFSLKAFPLIGNRKAGSLRDLINLNIGLNTYKRFFAPKAACRIEKLPVKFLKTTELKSRNISVPAIIPSSLNLNPLVGYFAYEFDAI